MLQVGLLPLDTIRQDLLQFPSPGVGHVIPTELCGHICKADAQLWVPLENRAAKAVPTHVPLPQGIESPSQQVVPGVLPERKQKKLYS